MAAATVLAAIAVVRLRESADLEPRVRPVTALPGLERSPSLSPDGNLFSWTGEDPQGVPDLWIKAVDGEESRQLTRTPTAEFNPAWSPDGRVIAFARGGQGIMVISPEGGQERSIMNSGSIVGWTPDSQWLLVRDRTPDGPHGIVRVNRRSGERFQVTRPSVGIGDWTFDVSPDGKMLAFFRYERPGISDLYTVPLAGGEPQRRTNWNASVSNVVWTSDGRDLLYSVDLAGGGRSVFRVGADGEGVGRGELAFQAGGPGLSSSRPAADRPARLAFTNERVDVNIRRLNLESAGGGIFNNVDRFSDSTRQDIPGPFSHDAKRVAFVSDRTGWPEVWVANGDGSGVRQLTTLHGNEMVIGGWSRHDDHLVIDAAVDGNSDVYVVPLDGGRPRRITDHASFDGLSDWSSDGHWIFFTSTRSGTAEVWKVPADGGDPTRLTYKGGLQPRAAPDGGTLFYLDRSPAGVGGTSGTGKLMSVPIVGGEETVVLDGIRLALWSVVETGIVFLTIETSGDAIDFYRFSDRMVRRLGTLPFRVCRSAGLGALTVSRTAGWR